MGVAEDLRRGLQACVVVSIGPTTTEELQHYGVKPDFEPSRPKMGFMINEAAQYAGKVLATKRTPVPPLDLTTVALEDTALPRAKNAELPITAEASARGVMQVAPSTSTMAGFLDGLAPLDILQEVSSRIATADPLHVVLGRIVKFVSTVFPCDSCFLYTVEEDELVLRASKNPHEDVVDRLKISVGEGVTGWVAEHREAVAISEHASKDARFSPFLSLPEDSFEAMLCVPILCANRVVGVLNLQHREPYTHTDLERRLLSTIGTLVGAEMERARLETENSELVQRLETRKLVDRAKGVLLRDLKISEDEAYRTMQRESRQRRRPMREIAEAILLAEELRQAGAAKSGA
jgi:uroporphyrinogen-III synthase